MNRPKAKIPKGRTRYSFHIYNHKNVRVQVMTGTDDKNEAEELIDHYMKIIGLEPDNPIALAIDPRVYKAYFGFIQSKIDIRGKLTEVIFDKKERSIIDKQLGNYPDILIKLTKLIVSHDQRGKTISSNLEELKQYSSLKKTIIGRQVEAEKRTKTYKVCLDEFELEYRDTVSYSRCVDVLSINQRFIDFLPEEIKPPEVTKDQLRDFINKLASESDNPSYRKKKVRSMLSVFFVWAADRYNFINPVSGLKLQLPKITKKKKITWYDLPVIEEILSGLDSYWSAIVATMAYAGIGVKELSGIRREDFIKATRIIENKKEVEVYFLRIEWHDERGLKTKNRSDDVPVDANYLLPRLLKYLEDGHAGKEYLFPRPKQMRKYNYEMWKPSDLSHKLVGRKYPKKEDGTQPLGPSILPPGMLARDLRHTFGSLLIRNGYSIDEACSLTRNTREVFMEHYGHLVAKELTVSLDGKEKKVKFINERSVIEDELYASKNEN